MKRTLPSIAAIGSIVALVAVPAFADTFQPKESMFAPPDVSWNSVVTGEIQGPATATFTDYTFDLSSLLDQQDGTVGDDGIFAPQFTSAFPGGKAKTWGMQFDLSLTDHGTTLFQDGTFVDHALMDAVAGKGWSWTSDTYEMGAKFTPQDAWVDGNVDISAVGTVLGDQQREMIQLSGLIPAINVTDDGFKQAMVVSGGYDTEASGVQFDVVTEADGGTTPAFKQFAVLPTYTERGDQLSS